MYLENEHKEEIETRKSLFEKHKVLTNLINDMSKEKNDPANDNDNDPNEDFVLEETTSVEEIESFENWAKGQAKVELRRYKELTLLKIIYII